MTKRDIANEKEKKYYHANKHKKPWVGRYRNAVNRCTNPLCDKFYLYGGKGIEVEMTMEDMEYLWFRDQAGNMEKASISRKDHDENYTIDNCEFIEQREHSSRDGKGRTTPSADRKKAAREKVRIKKSVMAQLIVECGNREPTAEELGVTHRVWITT